TGQTFDLSTQNNNFGTVSLATASTGTITSASVTDTVNGMSIGGSATTLNATAADQLTLTGGTYTTLNATSKATGINQSTGPLLVSGTTTLTADTGTGQTFDLSTQNNNFGTVSLATASTGTITSASVTDTVNGMSIGGSATTLNATAADQLTLTGGTYTTLNATSKATGINQSTGPLLVSGTTTLTADTGTGQTFDLSTQNNNFGTVSLATASTGTITSASVTDTVNGMSIGGSATTLNATAADQLTLTGGTYTTLNATSKATGINQSTGPLLVSGTTTLTADTGTGQTFDLSTQNNNFGTVSLATASTGTITSASVTDTVNGMSIGGSATTLNATAADQLTLTGGTYTTLNATSKATGINQSTGPLLVSGTTTLTADTGTGQTFDLSTQNNNFGTVSLATASTGTITSASVTDTVNGMSIGGSATTLNATAADQLTLTGGTYTTLNATSKATGINQSTGPLLVSGTTTLTADTGTGQTFDLSTQNNNFGTVSLATASTGTITSASVTDTVNGMSIGGSATTLNATAADQLTLTGGTYTTLNATSKATGINQSTGPLLVSGTTTLTADTGTGQTFDLSTQNNNFGTVSLATASTGTITSASVTDTVNGMSIGGSATTLNATAADQLTLTGGTYTTLNATSKATGINQSTGPLLVSGTTTLTADTGTGQTFDLSTQNNNFGTVSLATASTGTITSASVTDTVNGMSIGGSATTLNATAADQLTLTGGTYTTLNATSKATGINQSTGPLLVSGTTTLTADTGTGQTFDLSTQNNNFGTVSLATASTGTITSASVTDTVNGMSIGGSATTLNATAADQLTLTGGTYTTLNATSKATGINQSTGPLLVSGTTTLTADTGTGQTFDLSTQNNNFGTVSLATASTGTITSASVTDTVNGMSIGGSATTLNA